MLFNTPYCTHINTYLYIYVYIVHIFTKLIRAPKGALAGATDRVENNFPDYYGLWVRKWDVTIRTECLFCLTNGLKHPVS